MTLFALPYWLEWRLIIILFVGVFLAVIWIDQGSLRIIPESIWEFIKRLWDMFFHNIEDREAYDANAEQRKADEEYKKALKNKKGSKGGKAGNETESETNKDNKKGNEVSDRPY